MTAVAEPGQGVTEEELALAARNHGMPLECLRYDVTPLGMHYLLIHFDIPETDTRTWRVRVHGNVATELELTLDDIRSRPAKTVPVTLECAGNGRARLEPRPLSQPWLLEAVGTARWTGASLSDVLAEAGVEDGSREVVFTGADRGIQGEVEQSYQRSLTVADAMRPEVLLCYEMNEHPLLPQHGFPLRLLVPGWYGMTSVKWLTDIEVATEAFTGYQQAESYRYQQDEDDPGEPVERIRVRALMVPPGIPDFFTRHRLVDHGTVVLQGRAWCGSAPVTAVEVGVDGAWGEAELEEPLGEFAWRRWTYRWEAEPGEHTLACRATDADGNTQPTTQPWNLQGMSNNLVQEVPVTVR